MKLSNRALLSIVPVLFLSYCLAAISVYFSLADTTKRLEQTRLELATTELAASFDQYSNFAENYLLTLLENSAFRNLISGNERVYHHVALGSSIESTIQNFKQHQSAKLSFTVIELRPEEKELYSFELSDDPFSVVSEQQKKSYRRMLKEKKTSAWDLIEQKEDQTSIVVNRLVDRITYQTPVRTLLDNSVVVQLTLEPTRYLELKQKLEKYYNTNITTAKSETSRSYGLTSSHKIGAGLVLYINVPEAYLDNKLATTKIILTTLALIFFILSALLLFRLIKKYVTNPIAHLENELSDVITNNKENIEIRHGKQDEIGRLEKTFHKIYGDLSKSYLKTKELAEHDPLTKLHNLSYVSEYVQNALIKAKQNNDCIALIYIDLDNFKFVNDKHGHGTGDALLKAFANKLIHVISHAGSICDNDSIETLPGRIAGDEFSVIVTNFKHHEVPEKIAQHILSIFNNGFIFEQGQFPVSASIGIAMSPQDGHTISQLVSNADNAMYQAKHNGKNKIAFYSKELALSMRRRTDIEQELKAFNPNEELFLVYMPLVKASTNTIEGFEVLVRWISPKLGFVGPDEFIPIAETSGLFTKIDSWVTEEACKLYQPLKKRLGRDYKLSINLSSAQLNMNIIGDHLNYLIETYQLNPKYIQLEMTETLNVEYTDQASTLLNTLCEQGFQIAIDDFGTGYTALLQLIEYPAHMIKFDKVFVDKAMHPDNRSMLEPLISLCHSQNLQVTVEGVETKEMADYLKGIGCDYLQGFYYGKPVKLEELNLDITKL